MNDVLTVVGVTLCLSVAVYSFYTVGALLRHVAWARLLNSLHGRVNDIMDERERYLDSRVMVQGDLNEQERSALQADIRLWFERVDAAFEEYERAYEAGPKWKFLFSVDGTSERR